MRINVRNMVCRHCVNALYNALTQLGYTVTDIGLGFADISPDIANDDAARALDEELRKLGFERIVEPTLQLVEKVKHEVLEHINGEEPCNLNLSHCISAATGMDYNTVSRIFSAAEGRTIEKYYIAAKIEKAKELLSYDDLPITEVAYRLGYSSVAFFSRQFKQETGMPPSQYQASESRRRSLMDI